ncbi:MAG TPA: SRPBCC family protein [Spongiibacteraceae bacterium]|nr:SRPBCC family protein [Spongiibacteraceae bacterium]
MSSTTCFDSEQGVFRHRRTLANSADKVFAAFADPIRLAQWWGPDGFTNTFEIFEFKNDGQWKFIMHGADGADYPNDSVFQNIVPNERIVIRHCCAPYFTLTVSLQPQATATEIIWEQAFDNPAVAAQLRVICEPGNEQNLDRLQQLLAGSAS